MNDQLKKKLDAAREDIQTEYVQMRSDPALTSEQKEKRSDEIHRKEKLLAESLSAEDRKQVEDRIKELAPQAAIPTSPRMLDSSRPVKAVDWQVPDEYYFLRRLASRWE